MYDILFSELASKQLSKLEKTVQTRIISALERIRIKPEAHLKKLVGDIGFRLRAGDYRVIVDLNQGKLLILVIKVGHRKGIYK
ncbi:MAG: type II toxin-antitoxin system RelE/ParE family toxin [Candidatus Woesearchaeota archaeon]